MDSAFRDAVKVGLAQRHRDDVQPVVSRLAGDLACQTETREDTVGVVVRPAADVGDHAGDRVGAKRLGAQLDSETLELVGVFARDQQLHLAPLRGHGGKVALHQFHAGRAGELAEPCHAVV